ncbi:MAG: 2-iminobutanoate/2-iminopropanoate deaminase [Solirubrobacteraceae bacterium]
MTRTAIIPPETRDLPLPFSPAVRAGDTVYVSGQAAVDENGRVVSGPFEDEMRRSMENLRTVLRAAGGSLDDVVQVRAYVHDAANLEVYNSLYREYFDEPLPARTTITNCLGSVKFEIDAVAHIPERASTSAVAHDGAL